jgi:hypothetical protein
MLSAFSMAEMQRLCSLHGRTFGTLLRFNRNGQSSPGWLCWREVNLQAVTDWMFTHVGLHRVYLVHSTRNEACCRVAAGAEFLVEGTKRSASLHLDGWHDMHLHARVNDHWLG